MAGDWIMVRLLRTTHSELERVRASMELGEWMGLTELERDPRHRVSLDQIIRRLIRFRDRHAERARRSKARRKAAAAAAASAVTEGGVPQARDLTAL
jgi:hypothetical protein